jgi:hypothetical protein
MAWPSVVDKTNDDVKELFIQGLVTLKKKVNFILDNTIASLRIQGKGLTTKSEKAYWTG